MRQSSNGRSQAMMTTNRPMFVSCSKNLPGNPRTLAERFSGRYHATESARNIGRLGVSDGIQTGMFSACQL